MLSLAGWARHGPCSNRILRIMQQRIALGSNMGSISPLLPIVFQIYHESGNWESNLVPIMLQELHFEQRRRRALLDNAMTSPHDSDG